MKRTLVILLFVLFAIIVFVYVCIGKKSDSLHIAYSNDVSSIIMHKIEKSMSIDFNGEPYSYIEVGDC